MSYAKTMKHFHNHRKDRYYQQCGFSMNETSIKSYAAIAEETAELYYIFNDSTQQRITEKFSDWDKAVDTYRELLPIFHNIKIYTDKGMVIAQ